MNGEILVGDCRDLLRTLPDESVHCCVTSPPYFGLRDYGTGSWEGGDPTCDHLGDPMRTSANINANWGAGFDDVKNSQKRTPFKDVCGKCGARRVDQQVGLETSPAAFVKTLVDLAREVRRVLRKDGSFWLNLGDTYASSSTYNVDQTIATEHGWKQAGGSTRTGAYARDIGLKPKDLIGIPWRAAFGLQDDGWYLRQDIIWQKPNPMPESVRDRCTKAHEYIFLLTKSERYYFDSAAIKEPAVYPAGPNSPDAIASPYGQGFSRKNSFSRATKDNGGVSGKKRQHREDREPINYQGTRNKRSVWSVSTVPYKEAHFATYPPKLIEPCILAGSPPGGVVLDPFLGAGTTGLVAQRLDRRFIGLELNPKYAAMAERRIAAETPTEQDALWRWALAS